MRTRLPILAGLLAGLAAVAAGAPACQNPLAECGDCDFGAARCVGQAFQRCYNDTGSDCATWHVDATCAEDEVCAADGEPACRDCGGCAAGASRCVAGQEQRCLTDGACVYWDVPRGCAPGLACLDGSDACAPCADECAAGAARCDGTGRQTCASNGACLRWTATEPCPPGEACTGTAQACQPICALRGLAFGVPACGLQASGAPFCWGPNPSGALGTGSLEPAQADLPVAAEALGGAAAQLAITGDDTPPGAATTCARRLDGTVWCLGSNFRGALGAGTAEPASLLALPVTGLADAIDLSAGLNHLCAVTGAGEVRCWGEGGAGQLGTGAQADAAEPVAVQGLPAAARRVWCGGDACCAAVAGGGLWCWGSQQGTLATLVPRDAAPLPGEVAEMVLTHAQRCLVTTGGAAACAGANTHGSLGDGTTTSRSTFAAVSGLSADVRSLAAYAQYPFDATLCAAKVDGSVWCWGLSSGIVSDPALVPEPLGPLAPGVEALAGRYALGSDGRWFSYRSARWWPLFDCP